MASWLGYIASRIQKDEGSGCLVNLFLGVIGGLVGGWLFSLIGIAAYGWIGEMITAIVGAVVVHVVPAPAGGSQSQQQNTEKQERDPSAFHDFTPPDSGIASSVSADCGNIPGTSGILFLKTVG